MNETFEFSVETPMQSSVTGEAETGLSPDDAAGEQKVSEHSLWPALLALGLLLVGLGLLNHVVVVALGGVVVLGALIGWLGQPWTT